MRVNILRLSPLLIMFMLLLPVSQATAQSAIGTLTCGQIIEAETTSNQRFQDYQIQAPAGTI
jgi:hypothetical protein